MEPWMKSLMLFLKTLLIVKQGCSQFLLEQAVLRAQKVSLLFFKKNKIKHEVLNAKQHEREAEIVANAGAPGAVTISTNMAGRGTDIVLGGRPIEGASESEKQAWMKNMMLY